MPYNYMDDLYGGAYEDYSGGGGDTSWMSPTYQSPASKKPWEYDYAPSSGMDFMQNSAYNPEPYQLEPYQPLQQPSLSQAPPPTTSFAPDWMKPMNSPYENLFPTEMTGGVQPRNDPMSVGRTFPTPPDFMAPETQATEPTANIVGGKQERDFPLLDRFAELAWNRPTREQYKPGKMANIMAAMTGGLTGMQKGAAAGIAAGRAQKEAPYMQAMEDWKEQLAAGKDAATLERYQAENRRKEGYGDSLLDLRRGQGKDKYLLDKAKYEAAGWVYKENATTGEAMRINLRTGEREDLGKVGLSTQEKIALKGAEAGAVSTATMGDRTKLKEMDITAADKRQGRSIASQISLQQTSIDAAEAAQRRAADNAATGRRENFVYGVLGKELDQIRRTNDPTNLVSIREATRKTEIDEPYLSSKFFEVNGDPKYDVINDDANAAEWARYKARLLKNTRKGVQPK